jgi:hypothetical protein
LLLSSALELERSLVKENLIINQGVVMDVQGAIEEL